MRGDWTWAWYWGRVKYELRWFPWGVKRVLRGESRWYAPVRALWHALVLMYESEICAVCGHPVGAVWHASDPLWLTVNGHYGGTTCMSCFNRAARAAGEHPYWEVAAGGYPSCNGNPCAHVKPMLVQSEAAEEYWAALVEVAGGADAARAVVDRRREAAPLGRPDVVPPKHREEVSAMQNIVVGRYLDRMDMDGQRDAPLAVGRVENPEQEYEGWIEPEDRSWIMFVRDDHTPEVYLSRDPETGAVV